MAVKIRLMYGFSVNELALYILQLYTYVKKNSTTVYREKEVLRTQNPVSRYRRIKKQI